MRAEPLLILVSGETRNAEQHTGQLAFTTTAKGLQFTSCSGILLSAANLHDGLVLLPAAVLHRWLKPGITPQDSIEPPSLSADCAICAVGPATVLSGGAAMCIPIATVRVPAVSRSAAQLLQSLNRGTSSSDWAFGWHIGGSHCTPVEQGSFVLCWTQPVSGCSVDTGVAAGFTSAPDPPKPHIYATFAANEAANPASSNGSGATATWPGPHPRLDKWGTQYGNGDEGAAIARGTLTTPQCVALMASLYSSLSAARDCGIPGPISGNGGSATVGVEAVSLRQQVHATDCELAAPAAGSPRPNCASAETRPGCLVSIVGSPFGCLAPFHFSNAVFNGVIACALPEPHDHTAYIPAGGAAASGSANHVKTDSDVRCSCGPALYALDAHVFPGMEGALVTVLQAPGAAAVELGGSNCQGRTPPRGCPGHVGGSRSPAFPLQPLALLCIPVSRRADGVQVPLAAGWSHVAAALRDVLAQLLLRSQGASADGAAAVAHLISSTSTTREKQQLQLQPVAASSLMDAATAAACCVSGCCHARATCNGGMHSGPFEARGRASHSIGTGLWSVGIAGRHVARPHDSRAAAAATVGPLAAAALQPRSLSGILPAAPVPSACLLSRAMTAADSAQPGAYPHSCSGVPAAALLANATFATAMIAECSSAAVSPAALAAGAAAEGLPSWVLQAVVLLRYNGSWATGVIIESSTGRLVTTAHLFQRPSDSAGTPPHNRPTRGHGGGGDDTWARLQCWVRVPSIIGSGGSGAGGVNAACVTCGGARSSRGPVYRWVRARVLYMWSNHLDLAVLQLEPSYTSRWTSVPALAEVRHTARARDDATRDPPVFRPTPGSKVATLVNTDNAGAEVEPYSVYSPGTPVWAVGHSLVGPSAEWPALVSYGCVARVLRVHSGRPSMVIASTTTHAGGSGGALLDCHGRLVGLVTSNARHAGGITLPNMAFCIAAEELAPVIRWAAATASSSMMGTAQRGRGLSELAKLDVSDEDAARMWRLLMPSLEPPAPTDIAAAAAAAAAGKELIYGVDGTYRIQTTGTTGATGAGAAGDEGEVAAALLPRGGRSRL
ncbi:hypothetical protein VaNZ11_003638 [Volvox africanus]|uniref:Glyoxysomal processing protease, glyoxysomal n=1 Tax=Volvox africanus TaxID=51714 RepID=A0ABQ5RUP2_9CHLO|nr:hypothetical protein VaNZ11_003638 [Volvox africanus]